MLLPVGAPTAHAATRTQQLTTIPKKLRGTWYHYYGRNTDGLRKTVMTKHHYRSYRDGHRIANLKHVVVQRTTTKGKWQHYTIMNRQDPRNNYQESSFSLRQMKLRGKKQWILVQSQHLSSLKPVVLTHFKPGTHRYSLPTSAYRFM
ncbi:hypothetical protein [Levilactobacillus suantsaii]|uniref:Uncharacterized protein n=1 Tax=Levilactobacillus suantsaii TaxID=2292255 RepID=A0A4Q0VIX8_9LACO|nr:hypothetical protein [Levilactobacillus suantsaii]QMU08767.1 hypothetical protein H3M12_03660 [Levilactobacillus suantsaii]RXI78938.1 hypothetical protein DXH47_05355 [Levilactobacillus suantsaii]